MKQTEKSGQVKVTKQSTAKYMHMIYMKQNKSIKAADVSDPEKAVEDEGRGRG